MQEVLRRQKKPLTPKFHPHKPARTVDQNPFYGKTSNYSKIVVLKIAEAAGYKVNVFTRANQVFIEAYAPMPEKGNVVTVQILGKVGKHDMTQNGIEVLIPLDSEMDRKAYGINHKIGILDQFHKVSSSRAKMELAEFEELFPAFDLTFVVP